MLLVYATPAVSIHKIVYSMHDKGRYIMEQAHIFIPICVLSLPISFSLTVPFFVKRHLAPSSKSKEKPSNLTLCKYPNTNLPLNSKGYEHLKGERVKDQMNDKKTSITHQ